MNGVLERLALAVWLALLWLLLWGSSSLLAIGSALLVGPLCLAAGRLPALPVVARPRWRRLPMSLVRFATDVLASSVQVAWATLAHGPRTRSAVLAVPVGRPSATALTVVVNRLSLEPGTLVLGVVPEAGEIYVFVLDVRGGEGLERARRHACRAAHDVLRTLGEDIPESQESGSEGSDRA
ncbi:Na+/H+ antiporter subunit E [Plantactinospora sp. CA-294935]|uniref:Na+/H+ antiporter subunit E n=1 Tax=Plantactinospora sp. CA-294935 TaxID=3240012 RepID=UPI003D8A0D5D